MDITAVERYYSSSSVSWTLKLLIRFCAFRAVNVVTVFIRNRYITLVAVVIGNRG
jgi:hypothetical protein